MSLKFLHPLELWKTRFILLLIEVIIHFIVVTSFYFILIAFNQSIIDIITLTLIAIYGGFVLLIFLQYISSIKTRKSITENKEIPFIFKLIAKITIIFSLLFALSSYVVTLMILPKPEFFNEILNPLNLILEILVIPLIIFRVVITFEFLPAFLAKDFRGMISEIPKPSIKSTPKVSKPKPEKGRAIEEEEINKIKKMISVSTKIELDRMQNALKMEKKEFDEKIFDWAERFNFTIDRDHIIINRATVDDFIDMLDGHFEHWGKKEKNGSDKI